MKERHRLAGAWLQLDAEEAAALDRQAFACEVGRRTLSKVLYTHDLSWKKCQEVLKRANPAKRAAFMTAFQKLYTQVCQGAMRLITLMGRSSSGHGSGLYLGTEG
ncbi:MAG: hypothetical protein IPM07_10275 [Anaerolineales bacterium]|nr:hypothetical protein [Anaerolineales bacterium]